MRAIVLATRNPGKIAELSRLLAGFSLEVKGLDAFPGIGELPETGDTFRANALEKARTAATLTGLVAVADDSGLEVDALGGAPGVYSARYSGPRACDADNNSKLLAALAEVPPGQRAARFRCVMAAAAPNGETLLAEGAWEGEIARELTGQGGFGYDPLFLDPAQGRTAAQMSPEEKNAASHRGRALRALLAAWPGFWRRAGLEK